MFVHGLGGGSRKTWSKNHDPRLFWPKHWLPLDSDVRKARILSFGYNADFRPGSSRNTSNISDFAKVLLYELGFGKDENGKSLGIGLVPVIFVVHSMGGLVAKKAYLLGQNDERYRDIVRAISAIVFLATPHRGTDLAQTLNQILMVSFQTRKSFIGDLVRSSPALEDLNEQFRHIAPRLSIVSLYETLPTSIGSMELMVVEKESSTLGYPGEISRALHADHHEVCKYPDPENSNYIAVRNALKSLVKELIQEGADTLSEPLDIGTMESETLFAAPPDPVEDFDSFRRQWAPGTCDWLLHEPDVESWLDGTLESCIVWLVAPPGSGKSILSTHIINHLQTSGIACQYFFFRAGDCTKSSLSTLLKSIAYQVARDIPTFKSALADLSKEGIRLEQADPVLIWHKLFELILFRMELPEPLYWVIDGLDESDSPNALLDLLRGISNSRVPIRLLAVGRKLQSLVLSFNSLSESISVKIVETGYRKQVSEDIDMVVEKKLKLLSVSDELKQRVTQSIIDRAKGNFLWVQFVLEEIINCRSEDAIQGILNEVPDDMNRLYKRMELSLLNDLQENDRRLATVLFEWVICAQRSLTLKELSLAISPEFSKLLNLERTIGDVCGQFIFVEGAGRVRIMHQTARDYLIETSDVFSVDPPRAHAQLLIKTLSALQDPQLRIKLAQGQRTLRSMNPFVFYAATSWIYHLQHADATSDEALDILLKLFKNPYVLTWISLLAYIGQLEVLPEAADALVTFVCENREGSTIRNLTPHRLSDLESLEQWAVDLVEVACKFSRHLLLQPLAIYKLVPPFCPENSALRQQFHQPGLAEVLVSGISNTAWSDNLARIVLPNGERTFEIIACAGPYIAVVGFSGRIFLWDSYNFTKVCTLDHEDNIATICFNGSGDKLVSYGLDKSTKLWSIPSGKLLGEAPNPANAKAIKMTFAEKDTRILSVMGDRVIRYLLTDQFATGWCVLNPALPSEDGDSIHLPSGVAFNQDATQVGLSYKAFPLSVWGLDELNCIGRCKRAKEPSRRQGNHSTGWSPVKSFTFNPVSGHVVGIYRDGTVFKWHPVTGENFEVISIRCAAHEVAVSPDGKLFITYNTNRVIKVWDFANFNDIYQLTAGDLSVGLIFGPDCKRFYDIGFSTINAWEPNILSGFSGACGHSSEVSSEEQSPAHELQTSGKPPAAYEAVSVLSVSPDNSFYCVGNDHGRVKLFETHSQESIELEKFLDFFGVANLAWAKDSSLIAASSLSHEVVVKRLGPGRGSIKNGMLVESMPSPKVDLNSGIFHMLFNSDASLLLLIGVNRGQILSVGSGTTRAVSALECDSSRWWFTHPTQNQFFLGVGAVDAKVYRWDDFKEQTCLLFPEDLQHSDHRTILRPNQNLPEDSMGSGRDSPLGSAFSVHKAMHTQDGEHLLVQTKHRSPRARNRNRLLIFNVYDFEVGNDEDAVPPMPAYFHIPPTIEDSVEYPLGILSGSRLVFLDADLWVCTVKLHSWSKELVIRRHYFIPRDWTSNEGLEQCFLLADGTILCPKGDEVAVMMGDLDSVGF